MQIIKYTPEDYYDRENLVLALEKAEDICSQVHNFFGDTFGPFFVVITFQCWNIGQKVSYLQ